MKEKKEINIQIGAQVHIAREQAKLTQEELAEALEVSPQYISDLERGVVGIAIPTLKNLCTVLKVSSDQILFGAVNKNREMILSNSCKNLNDTEFDLLIEIIERYVKALNKN